MPEFSVVSGDVTEVPSDLLLLKHARDFYGADWKVASLLTSKGICSEKDLRPKQGEFALLDTRGIIAPSRVLFLGTRELDSFGYEEMRQFARRAMEFIVAQDLPIESLTTTVHGVMNGLDAGESFQYLALGFQQVLRTLPAPRISKIIFVDKDERTARILRSALGDPERGGASPAVDLGSGLSVQRGPTSSTPTTEESVYSKTPASAARKETVLSKTSLKEKEHVFVAMPYSEEFQDVYEFGIYAPVRQCGFICEKLDEMSFTGDILQRIRERIRAAKFVIADMTQARANVYLEVGYAWGHGIPVIFLAKEGEKLHFDVSTHRCIYYRSIRQLAKDLEKLIRGLCSPTDG